MQSKTDEGEKIMKRPIVLGNWKTNKTVAESLGYMDVLIDDCEIDRYDNVDVVITPGASYAPEEITSAVNQALAEAGEEGKAVLFFDQAYTVTEHKEDENEDRDS